MQKDPTLQKPLSTQNQELLQTISKTPNSCFIHIRRGDYLASHNWMFVKLGKTYYEETIKLVAKNIGTPTFFIFSNDIQWCKEWFLNLLDQRLITQYNFVFIDTNPESNASEELALMKSSQNDIVANSTFSWWVAFLQNHPTKTIVIPNQLVYYEYNDKNFIPPQSKGKNMVNGIPLDWCWGSLQK